MISIIIGIVAFFFMSPSITQPASAFKRSDGTNKWWTEKEELILVNRLLRDDPTKGDLNNRTAVSLKETLRTIVAPDLLPIYIVCHSTYPLRIETKLTRSRSVYSRGYLSNPRPITSPSPFATWATRSLKRTSSPSPATCSSHST
jgi:hypothetical protein